MHFYSSFLLACSLVFSSLRSTIAVEDFARLLNDASSSQVEPFFVDSRNTYYDGYQQAWRYLGFYVDCYTKEGQKVCQRYLLWAAVRGWTGVNSFF